MIKKITVGDHEVTVEITPRQDGIVDFTAFCGDVVKRSPLNPTQGKHDMSVEEYEKIIDDRAQLLAKEVAGHSQAKTLADNFFKDDAAPQS